MSLTQSRRSNSSYPYNVVTKSFQFRCYDCSNGSAQRMSRHFDRDIIPWWTEQWEHIFYDPIGMIQKSNMKVTVKFFVIGMPKLKTDKAKKTSDQKVSWNR